MIRLFLLCLLLHAAHPKDIWRSAPTTLSNITLKKNTPIVLPQEEEEVTFSHLNGTLYSNSLSQLKAKGVRLAFDHLEKIEPGAICSSGVLKKVEIFLGGNNGVRVSNDLLKNCESLEELSVVGDYDKLHQVDEDAFTALPHLKNLNLVQVEVQHVKKEYFNNLHALEFLTLRKCAVEDIASDAFQDLTNLKELEIFFNRELTHLPENLFKDNGKLERLLLVSNNITGLTWDEFKGLSSLKELHVGRNNISSYDAEKIAKNLPKLKEFSFELNPKECKEREAFAKELKKKLGRSIHIVHKFDPGFYDSCEDEREI